VEPFGDEAILVTLGAQVDPAVARRVRTMAAALVEARGGGLPIGAPVPAFASLLVPFDIGRLGAADARAAVARIVDDADRGPGEAGDEERGPVIDVPTRYGGADGEDLESVAEQSGLSPAAVVDLHASTEYEVFMLGFAPGFAYLGIVPEEIAVPRRPTPRSRVPAGSVALAERQTAVYPSETPGGWNLIGRTELVLWDATRDAPALLAPGDRVRFVPIR